MNSLDYQNIFHEIKNTITLVNSSMQLLDNKCPHLKSEAYWNNIKHEITYLKNMVLEISKAGTMEHLQKEPLNLNDLLLDLCNSLKDTFPHMQWDLQLDENIPPLYADHMKITQAVVNLLKNSAEASNEAGNISIKTRSMDLDIILSISDSGGGIPAELEDKVFELFTTSKQHGTGLGLAITKHIIECHNGTLTLENHPGIGCTFTICLPCQQTPSP